MIFTFTKNSIASLCTDLQKEDCLFHDHVWFSFLLFNEFINVDEFLVKLNKHISG